MRVRDAGLHARRERLEQRRVAQRFRRVRLGAIAGVKLEIGVGRHVHAPRADRHLLADARAAFARCSGRVRVTSSSQLLPSAPSRSGVAGIGPSVEHAHAQAFERAREQRSPRRRRAPM